MAEHPVFLVLALSAAAAATAAIGVLPLAGRTRLPSRWLAWANAIAAGTMLAAAYVMAQAGLDGPPLAMGAGALAGITFIHWSHAIAGTQDLGLNRLADTDPGYGYQVLLVSSLHSGAEGLAIGTAMAVDISLGTFVAVAIAVHNIPEATLVGAVFRSRGDTLGRVAVLAVVSDGAIVFTAVAAFAVVAAAPSLVPYSLGFAAGALIYLVTVDLLPESYGQARATTIALVTILAMGLVIAMQGLL